jgi:hypothetical protein
MSLIPTIFSSFVIVILQGVNLEGKGDGSEERVLTDREQVIQDRAARKAKPSKGGGGGFSKHKA